MPKASSPPSGASPDSLSRMRRWAVWRRSWAKKGRQTIVRLMVLACRRPGYRWPLAPRSDDRSGLLAAAAAATSAAKSSLLRCLAHHVQGEALHGAVGLSSASADALACRSSRRTGRTAETSFRNFCTEPFDHLGGDVGRLCRLRGLGGLRATERSVATSSAGTSALVSATGFMAATCMASRRRARRRRTRPHADARAVQVAGQPLPPAPFARRRKLMFSPILPIRPVRTSSSVGPAVLLVGSAASGPRRRRVFSATRTARPGKRQEHVVLGHEVGFAVDSRSSHRWSPAMCAATTPFGGHAPGSLAGLGARA